jgi:hypothetical protein
MQFWAVLRKNLDPTVFFFMVELSFAISIFTSLWQTFDCSLQKVKLRAQFSNAPLCRAEGEEEPVLLLLLPFGGKLKSYVRVDGPSQGQAEMHERSRSPTKVTLLTVDFGN